MNEETLIPGTGALKSEVDPRTVQHQADMAGAPLVTGGITYAASEHENQHRVGICTAISRVQLREKQRGKKYSPDFQYLLQKKFYDGGWYEGSSVLNANKVAKNYGFLPDELFYDLKGKRYVEEADRFMDYNSYAAKLQAIPEAEVQRLISLCVDKIQGYAQVDVSDPQVIAKAIISSPGQSGILCRYGCQMNWWTPSWRAADIDPLRWAPETSGHAIINSWFDYSNGHMQKLSNTWGPIWCLEGNAHINWDNYPMTEAFVDLETTPIIPPYIFSKVLKFGDRGFEVKMLQKKLGISADGIFGPQTKVAVQNFQSAHNLVADGIVGKLTNQQLNLL